MDDPVEKAAEQAVIEHDLACRGCGYNLRGLSPRSRCPECDQPISHALQGDWLRYSDPRWVTTIANGYRLLAGAVAIGLLAIIFAAASAHSLAIPWLTMAIALTVGVVSLVGVWMTTAREPAAAESERWYSDRRLLRVFTIVGVSLQASSGFLAMQFPAGGLYVRLAGAVIMIFGMLCAFRHAMSLADRIPDYALVNETRAVMWGLILSYGLFLGILAVALTAGGSPLAMMACGLFCTVAIACMIFSVWCLTLFARYAGAMRFAAAEARLVAQRGGA